MPVLRFKMCIGCIYPNITKKLCFFDKSKLKSTRNCNLFLSYAKAKLHLSFPFYFRKKTRFLAKKSAIYKSLIFVYFALVHGRPKKSDVQKINEKFKYLHEK